MVPIVGSAGAGELGGVQRFLDQGADPNGLPGYRPLIRAANNGDNGLLDALVARGVSLDIALAAVSTGLIGGNSPFSSSSGSTTSQPTTASSQPAAIQSMSPALMAVLHQNDRDLLDVLGKSNGTAPPGSTPGTSVGHTTGTTATSARLERCQGLLTILDDFQDTEGMLAPTPMPSRLYPAPSQRPGPRARRQIRSHQQSAQRSRRSFLIEMREQQPRTGWRRRHPCSS